MMVLYSIVHSVVLACRSEIVHTYFLNVDKNTWNETPIIASGKQCDGARIRLYVWQMPPDWRVIGVY